MAKTKRNDQVIVIGYSEIIMNDISNFLRKNGFDAMMTPIHAHNYGYIVSVPDSQKDEAFQQLKDYYNQTQDDSIKITCIDKKNCHVIVDTTVERTL